MSGRTKLLFVTLAALALGGFLSLREIIAPAHRGESAKGPTAPRELANRRQTARARLRCPQPSAGLDADAVAALYRSCVLKAFPSRADAAVRATVCSQALQTLEATGCSALQSNVASPVVGQMADEDLAGEHPERGSRPNHS